MSKVTSSSVVYNIESEVASLIADKKQIPIMEGLRLFLKSETHRMLLDDDMKLWYFAPLAIFDMWECEEKTGNPRNSLYLKGDECDEGV